MTKDEIFEKLQTEVTIRGLSPGTYYTYKRAIDLFLNWSGKELLGHSCFETTNVYLHIANTKVFKTSSPADSLTL